MSHTFRSRALLALLLLIEHAFLNHTHTPYLIANLDAPSLKRKYEQQLANEQAKAAQNKEKSGLEEILAEERAKKKRRTHKGDKKAFKF